jgi:hypothetical protein
MIHDLQRQSIIGLKILGNLVLKNIRKIVIVNIKHVSYNLTFSYYCTLTTLKPADGRQQFFITLIVNKRTHQIPKDIYVWSVHRVQKSKRRKICIPYFDMCWELTCCWWQSFFVPLLFFWRRAVCPKIQYFVCVCVCVFISSVFLVYIGDKT